jgi:hypothetical protein
MKCFIKGTFALAGLWCVIAIGSAIDPSFIPHAAGLVASILHKPAAPF